MASGTYRYAWSGVNVKSIENGVPASALPITVAGPAPLPLVDITIADSNDLEDLNDVMLSLGWEFHSANPSGKPQGIILRSCNKAEIDADVSTTSVNFVSLLSLPVIPVQASGTLEIEVTLSSTSVSSINYFRLTLDGNPIPNSGFSHMTGTGSTSIIKRVPITPGNHIVGLEWKVDALGSATIRPISEPTLEGCHMNVKEYSA